MSGGTCPDQLSVRVLRSGAQLPVGALRAIGQELDHARGVRQVALTFDHAERAGATRQQVHAAIVGAVQHAFDPAGTADVAQPVVGEPDDPELLVSREALADHRLEPLFEDVERHELRRQHDQLQREQREAVRVLGFQGHGRRAVSSRL